MSQITRSYSSNFLSSYLYMIISDHLEIKFLLFFDKKSSLFLLVRNHVKIKYLRTSTTYLHQFSNCQACFCQSSSGCESPEIEKDLLGPDKNL